MTRKLKEYNGHRSWNAWNVSLYISNEYDLYQIAVKALRATSSLGAAVRRFARETGIIGSKTPDGAVYNHLSVKLALEGLEIDQPKQYVLCFPDIDYEIPAVKGFEDISYKNDACPSFYHEKKGLLLWADYAAIEKREIEGGKRFTLINRPDLDDSYQQTIVCESDSIEEIKAFVEAFHAIKTA